MATVGMFMDGTIYAAVSRNLAEGVGSLWALHFSEGLFPVFREHPPLVFWLQSLFFRVLGDGFLTERAYDLIVVLATAWLMRSLWLRLVTTRGLASLAAFYWHKQVVGRSGVSGADVGMLFELAKKLAPMLLVLAGFRLWVGRDAKPGGWNKAGGPAVAMLAIGLAASVPLVMGDLDSAHYLVPAMPFFALGFALIGAGMLDEAGKRVRSALEAHPRNLFKMLALVAAAAILVMTLGRLGEVRRNEDYHAFLAQVADATGERSTLGIDAALYHDWYLHAIAQRHYRISLVPGLGDAEWRLVSAGQSRRPGYRVTEVAIGQWILLRRETAP